MSYIKLFVYLQDKQAAHFNAKDFDSFLINYPYKSQQQQDQIISSLKFFYKHVLDKKYSKVDFARPRKDRPIPKVVDGEQMATNINAIANLKHRSILSLAYDTGIRSSEILNLKIEHCDKNRMRFLILMSKRRKSREVPMSLSLRHLLRKYYKEYRPSYYLFNGQGSDQYSYSSLRAISNKYLGVNPHIIRHTYASELLRKGIDLRIIQKLLGHGSVKTTEIYTHVVDRDFDTVPSLLKAA